MFKTSLCYRAKPCLSSPPPNLCSFDIRFFLFLLLLFKPGSHRKEVGVVMRDAQPGPDGLVNMDASKMLFC